VPQILSKSSSTSVLPVAQAAASAPAAPAGPAHPHADLGAPDFLGQLKTALKNLTKVVMQPIVASGPAAPSAAAQAPGAEVPAAPAELQDAKVDHKSDVLPDLLATLGLVPVPIAFVPLDVPPEKTVEAAPAPFGAGASTASGASTGADASADSGPLADSGRLPDSGALAAPPQQAPLPKSVLPEVPQPPPGAAIAAAAVQLQAQLESSKLLKPEVQRSMPPGLMRTPEGHPLVSQSGAAKRAKTEIGASIADRSVPIASAAPSDSTVTTTESAATDPAPLAPGSMSTAPRGQSAAQHTGPLTGVANDVAPVIGSSQQHAHQDAFPRGSADDGRQPAAPKAAPIDDSASTPGVTAASDSAIAAAAGSIAANSVTPVLPPHVRPAEVVSQIAHQADLYRLPGNRGVRIELHPEGLGGVEVTLRYGVGGALQLHINVEHAATGSLVQAGWAELRDALATQGISPDRLVMSVTAPNGSSQLDFSGGGSGRQADPGTTGFAQSQSGQQRQNDPEQTGHRGWNGAIEPTSPSDDNPRVASASAATSRIDYRA
jgi:flagellar hook-length control protein FliK